MRMDAKSAVMDCAIILRLHRGHPLDRLTLAAFILFLMGRNSGIIVKKFGSPIAWLTCSGVKITGGCVLFILLDSFVRPVVDYRLLDASPRGKIIAQSTQ